jgi:D-alanyl-D-alanine carboxypeptidase/D-alanyl-D-alanine-endopeptidase (penicillin-binding protein 4)
VVKKLLLVGNGDGFVAGVSALSGYMIHKEFPRVVFSIIVNNARQDADARQKAIDSIVVLLPLLRLC